MGGIAASLLPLIAYIGLIQVWQKLPAAHTPGKFEPPDRTVKPPNHLAVERDAHRPATDTTGWFSFTLPWDDASPTWVDASDLLWDAPDDDLAALIDARGFVEIDVDGHFVFANTGERARFWGVNLAKGANLPPCPDYPPEPDAFPGEIYDEHAAEKLAGRLAKLGFNAVRLHCMDL